MINPQILPERRPRPAFTLVELLVVVGIISVLLAILLPALNRAREHANRVKCAANLRSIGQGMTYYVQEYRHYPGSHIIAGGPTYEAAVWPPRIRPYIGTKDVFFCPSRGDEFVWDEYGPPPFARAANKYVEAGYAPGEPLITIDSRFSYAYNSMGYRSGTNDDAVNNKGLGVWPWISFVWADKRFGEVHAARVRRPAEMIAVGDSNGDGVQDYQMTPMREWVRQYSGAIHAAGANVLFLDGHVTHYRQEDLLVGEPPTRAEAHKIRMWNNDHLAPWDIPPPFAGKGKAPGG